ncbi:MAG: serine/threonine-protein phosphatase, partial [Candidatus Eremiobacteraeota bacterium]|nr:serine/threonine-protein phosphatase [Candidatus Eremiobacteraeota bacterium]
IDPTRRLMHYTCAGHEPVFILCPDGRVIPLPPTAPLIGIFDDQHHLFKQAFVEITPGSIFIGATDGVTEARNSSNELFGMERLIATAKAHSGDSEEAIVQAILHDVEIFCDGKRRDDMAVVVVRFL